MEMQCYCDLNGHDKYPCPNTIDYMHHHDWGREEDYMCEDCLNNCLED